MILSNNAYDISQHHSCVTKDYLKNCWFDVWLELGDSKVAESHASNGFSRNPMKQICRFLNATIDEFLATAGSHW